MNLSLEGKVALVIGGTSGIGLAAAKQIVEAGAKVAVAGRDATKGLAAQSALGPSASFVACDVAQAQSVEALFCAVIARHGQIDCAVNSAALAAIGAGPALVHETSDADAAALLNTDVFGQFLCLKHKIAAMLKSGGGTIVNVSSVNGLSGTSGAAMYSAGRHAVVGLTRSAAREYIARHICINAVCPGATDTPRRQARVARLAPDKQGEVVAQVGPGHSHRPPRYVGRDRERHRVAFFPGLVLRRRSLPGGRRGGLFGVNDLQPQARARWQVLPSITSSDNQP